jgi:hypothetical protein
MGASVTMQLYPGMGHLVNEDEIARTQEIMDRVLAEAYPVSEWRVESESGE